MNSARVVRAAAAAAVTLLCAAGASGASASTFGAPTIVTGDDVSEPQIAVYNGNGSLYISAPVGVLSNLPGSPSNIYKSTDNGASWTTLPQGLKANLPGGGDADVAIDQSNGTLYETDLWLGSATVSTSKDGGQTWLANPFQGVPVQDRQWVATSGSGIVYHVTHQIPSGLIVSKSSGGLVYPIHNVAATPLDQTGCVCPPGNLIAEGTGATLGLSDKVGVIYATSSGGVKFARSTNGGLTFTNVTVGPATSGTTDGAFPVVANGGGGNLYAVWQENDADNSSLIKFASSHDWGATWGPTKTLVDSHTAGASLYPWVAAKGGKVGVSLFHTSTPGQSDTVPPSAVWFEDYLESTDGGQTFGALQQLDSTPVKTGPICSEGINCTGNRELGDFQSVTMDATGAVDVTWARSVDNQANTEIRFVQGR